MLEEHKRCCRTRESRTAAKRGLPRQGAPAFSTSQSGRNDGCWRRLTYLANNPITLTDPRANSQRAKSSDFVSYHKAAFLRSSSGVQILPVDWNVVQSALQQSRDGQNLKALSVLSALMQDTETDSERAAIVLGEASCYSQLENVKKSRELLESAKTYAHDDHVTGRTCPSEPDRTREEIRNGL
jgi:hypothetical protein